MTDQHTIGVGFIGAAAIAKKNARAISLAQNGIGEAMTCN